MSMRVQDALANCCDGVKEFASNAAAWIGRTVSTIGSTIGDLVSKVAQFVKPHFENFKTFAQENKESLLIAGVAFVVGAVISAVTYHVFCKGTGHHGTSSAATTV